MNTGVPNPVTNITEPVRTPSGANYQPNWRQLSQYLNALNTALQTIVPIRTVGTNYTVQLTDRVINVDATNNNVTVTIPSPAVFPSNQPVWGDFIYEVKRIDNGSNMVTIIAANGSTIDGASSLTLLGYAVARLRPYALYGASSAFSAWGLY